MTIINMLDLSTAHISKGTIYKLEKAARYGALYVIPHQYGYFVYVPDDEEPETPEDLKAIFKFAKSKNCSWIKLDCDAVEYKELPTYDWN